MQVSENSWHFRWYRKWQNWKRSTDQTYNWLLQTKEEPQLDLCHYFWIVVLFAPWRWFWQSSYRWEFLRPSTVFAALAATGAVSYASVTIPYIILKVLLFMVGCSVTAALMLLFVFSLTEYKWHEPLGRAIAKPFKKEKHKERTPKMRLFWEYAKAKKRKVCPLITVMEDEEVAS